MNPHTDLVWRKSPRSNNGGDCVEVADAAEVYVRDSKDREGPVVRFTRRSWGAFIEATKAGEFD